VSGVERYGSHGERVRRLQAALKRAGFYSGKTDGTYGRGTEGAVKKAQRAWGMKDDGVAGTKLHAAVDKFQQRKQKGAAPESKSPQHKTSMLDAAQKKASSGKHPQTDAAKHPGAGTKSASAPDRSPSAPAKSAPAAAETPPAGAETSAAAAETAPAAPAQSAPAAVPKLTAPFGPGGNAPQATGTPAPARQATTGTPASAPQATATPAPVPQATGTPEPMARATGLPTPAARPNGTGAPASPPAGTAPVAQAASAARAATASAIPASFTTDMVKNMTPEDKVREVMIGTVSSGQPYTGGGILFGDHMKAMKAGETPSFAQSSKTFGGYKTSELNSADQEGGVVDRFKQAGFNPMPSPSDLAKMSPDQIRQVARQQADHAAALNVRMIYAPVLDTQSSSKGDPSLYSEWKPGASYEGYDSGSRMENSRRYGSDLGTVEKTATTYLEAFKQRTHEIQDELRRKTGNPDAKFDVLVVAKHFPGESHPVDSDDAHIRETGSLDNLRARAQVFQNLKQKGLIDAVMVSNNEYTALGRGPGIGNPNLVGWAKSMGLPTTTDDTALPRRIKAGESIPQGAINAFNAGNTFIMVCDKGQVRTNVERALVDHVKRNPDAMRSLDERVATVLRLKQQAGLITR
jgi:beta-glucosidase-like glycosyl hydrolase/peptidoglycan hydrolase-like protein with peptidoglycan-binding domain